MGETPASEVDQRLIAALQCDGRLTAERAAEVLCVPVRTVLRRLSALFSDGCVRIVATQPRPPLGGVMLLRIRVLRGKLDTVVSALVAREDVLLVELSASRDQIIAVQQSGADDGDRLVFRQLPYSNAVLAVDAQTVIHVYSDAAEWVHDALTDEERRQLTPRRTAPASLAAVTDPLDLAIIDVLSRDGRASAAAVAQRVGSAESTVRRRLTALVQGGRLTIRAVVDPAALGLSVDATLRMQVAPGRLDEAGRILAAHPGVHGALVTTGPANLHVAVWLRDLDHLYRFITVDLADLGVASVDTVLIGESIKRPDTW